ncbi:hypothetical protein PLESTB_000461400 [Pleodorina starrii]|uniref:Uncharacterized protein n=1 Tax=Pleodorina starrii TaxID=330485 RepID=A0A9W6EZH0_9CHLO|nr:hypothetical protein PLESTM_000795800 [Pleodorina starrii]GLC51058.1 hypothetical protein PLESTB_000461400 [Pleodorina starrii]
MAAQAADQQLPGPRGALSGPGGLHRAAAAPPAPPPITPLTPFRSGDLNGGKSRRRLRGAPVRLRVVSVSLAKWAEGGTALLWRDLALPQSRPVWIALQTPPGCVGIGSGLPHVMAPGASPHNTSVRSCLGSMRGGGRQEVEVDRKFMFMFMFIMCSDTYKPAQSWHQQLTLCALLP